LSFPKTSYFYHKSRNHEIDQTNCFNLITFCFAFGFSSCEKIAEEEKDTDYEKKGYPHDCCPGSSGKYFYCTWHHGCFLYKETRLLNWSVTWTGLTGPGIPDAYTWVWRQVGYAAGVVYNIIAPANALAVPNATLYPCNRKISTAPCWLMDLL
jgi:hypothetical protein